MTMVEEPILSRLDRLDNIVKHLEEIRGINHNSAKSSCPSTPSSGTTLTSEGQGESSIDFSPKSLEKHCRPIDDVIIETERKGTLIQRLMHVEDRVFKLCVQLEEELEAEKKRGTNTNNNTNNVSSAEKKKHSKKGLKHMMRSCIPGKVGTNK